MVVLSLGHGLAELCRVFEHADEDLQTVEIGVLRRDHLENGLMKKKKEGVCAFAHHMQRFLLIGLAVMSLPATI